MKKGTKTRESNSLMLWLLKLINRVRGDEPLSVADRQMIAILLGKISRDEDARELFFESVRNRPKGDDSGLKSTAAFVYEARCELQDDKPKKAIVGEIADLSGLTVPQVDHAVRDYGQAMRTMIEGMDRPELAKTERSLSAWCASNSRRPRARGK